ncbi:hypothetical protein L204_101104 [Cryptococcus depauperatus]|nr:hypothetical protein L204_00966 [Cryptococcus depauperatus CBS 7855]
MIQKQFQVLNRGIHTKIQTFYSPTRQFLQQHLAANPLPKDSVSVYLLSTSLTDLPGNLAAVQDVSKRSIGSFSIEPAGSEPTLSLVTFWDANIHVFRSNLTGRASAEVGRYQRPERQRNVEEEELRRSQQKELEYVLSQDWEKVWKGESEGNSIRELEGVKPQSILLLSDSLPSPVLNALDKMFPMITKMGMLTAPTPFITNRPHTLLYNDQIVNSGTVGIAIEDREKSSKMNFGLSAVADPLTINHAKGNLLLKVEGSDSNPTQLLIKAIQGRGGCGITKENEFYLGFLENGEVTRVIKILSGDPSRGAMSLETEEPLVAGQTVQFMHRTTALNEPKPLPHSMTFYSLPRMEQIVEYSIGQPRVVDGFFACTEGGIIYSNPSTFVCTAPGAVATISWQ